MKVLIGCPVRQDENIFCHYLNSLKNLKGDFDLFFYLHDSPNLAKFLKEDQFEFCSGSSIYQPMKHKWSEQSLSEVAQMKTMLLEKALKEGYDYFFLVDSDTILHPDTLQHLLSLKKDIVAEILWTKAIDTNVLWPNAWEFDFFEFKKRIHTSETNHSRNILSQIKDILSNESNIDILKEQVYCKISSVIDEINFHNSDCYNIFKSKGVHKVGGIGGCNLISRKVIEAGVNYNPIYNVSFTNWEDRAFCIRAAVSGFNIYLDTQYPATHLYTEDCVKKYEESITA